jgi:hypothetical protein
MPGHTWHYPQLLPAVMSIPYRLMKTTEVQFFSYAALLPFLFVTLAAGYSLIDEGESLPALIMGVLVLLWFFRGDTHAQMIGYADFPVQSMGFYALCTMIMWGNRQNDKEKELFLRICSGAFIAGAAVTKQAGLPLLVFFPLIALERASGAINAPVSRRRLCILMAGIVLAALPWYIYVRIKLTMGIDTSEVSWVMGGVHEGRDFFVRLILAIKSFPFIFLWAGLALPALFVKRCRMTALFGVLYVFMWAVLLSYDIRNVSFAVPFLGFAIGSWPLVYRKKLISGFQIMTSIFQIVKDFCYRHKMKIIVICGIFVITAGTVISLVLNDILLNYNIKKECILDWDVK